MAAADSEQLAVEARPLDHQVAGHDGVLDTADGRVMKPCTDTEVDFYTFVTTSEDHRDLARCLPAFHGAVRLNDRTSPLVPQEDASRRGVENAVILENLLSGFRKPCVMDVKLGTQTYDEHATLEKKTRLSKEDQRTTTSTLGLRISGIKVYDASKADYVFYDKTYGKSLQPDNVGDAFSVYLGAAAARSTPYLRSVVHNFLDRASDIQRVMRTKALRMCGSSLLFVYEGDPSQEQLAAAESYGSGTTPAAADAATLRMIDFAHSYHRPGEGPDTGYLFGLENTLAQLKAAVPVSL